MYDVKGWLYQLGWNATHPKQPLRGMLYDVGYWKPKTPDFALYFQKPPTEIEERIVRSELELAKLLLAQDPPMANPTPTAASASTWLRESAGGSLDHLGCSWTRLSHDRHIHHRLLDWEIRMSTGKYRKDRKVKYAVRETLAPQKKQPARVSRPYQADYMERLIQTRKEQLS
jgi:hypothetical protein